MKPLLHMLLGLERLNRAVFSLAAVCCVLMALLGMSIVMARYGFSLGSIAAQELVMYLHAFVLLGAAASTLASDGHVRVDIFYRQWTARRRAFVNIAGHFILALPVMLFVLWESWDYVAQSWARSEVSSEAGGLPWVYALKSLILLFAVQMILQSVIEITKAWRGRGATEGAQQ
ncbi:MAG: TRAP transporter small permease subunit [Oceanococcus sp.]